MNFRELYESFSKDILKKIESGESKKSLKKETNLYALGYDINMSPEQAVEFCKNYIRTKHVEITIPNPSVGRALTDDNIVLRKCKDGMEYEFNRKVPFDYATSIIETDTEMKGIICFTINLSEAWIGEIDIEEFQTFKKIYNIDIPGILDKDTIEYKDLPQILDIFADPLNHLNPNNKNKTRS